MTIDIRPLANYKEIDQLGPLQLALGTRPESLIAAETFFALQKQGAALLGAIDRGATSERVVGFVCTVLGTVERLNQRRDPVAAARLKMFTLAMGVAPEVRGQGVGFRLKRAEREFALRIGVRLITSVFDPLDAHCARLHIGRLGAISHQYWRDFVGEAAADLRADRLHAEWWITSHRAEGRTSERRRPLSFEQLLGGGARLINPVTVGEAGVLRPGELLESSDASLLLVEIPTGIGTTDGWDAGTLASWRAHIRDVFESLFLDQYMITDFVEHTDDDGQRRSFYMLAQRSV